MRLVCVTKVSVVLHSLDDEERLKNSVGLPQLAIFDPSYFASTALCPFLHRLSASAAAPWSSPHLPKSGSPR